MCMCVREKVSLCERESERERGKEREREEDFHNGIILVLKAFLPPLPHIPHAIIAKFSMLLTTSKAQNFLHMRHQK